MYRSHLFPVSIVVPTALTPLSCVRVASSLEGFYGATRRCMLHRETTGQLNSMPKLRQPESIVYSGYCTPHMRDGTEGDQSVVK